jgi:hypothetical protein
MDEKITALITLGVQRARVHWQNVRAHAIERSSLPALLPCCLVPHYLKRLTRTGFNPFRDTTDVPVYRRQLAMLGASLRGWI